MTEREQPPSIRRRVEYLQRRGVARQRIGWFAPACMILAVVLTVVFFFWLSAGCVGGPQGGDVQQAAVIAEVRTVGAQVRDVNATLIRTHDETHQEVIAGRDATNQNNDAWTLRLLGLGVLLLGLSYPVGKIIWLLSRRVAGRAGVG